MPSSKFLIASNTLGSSAASVTFSSIPATYEDLVLLVSVRSTNTDSYPSIMDVNFNSDTTTLYSTTVLYGQDSSGGSLRRSNRAKLDVEGLSNTNTTSNTFASFEIYIPSYRVSQNKPISVYGVAEINSTTQNIIAAQAGLYRSTTAISSIVLAPVSANFVSGSSFWLYGLKSS